MDTLHGKTLFITGGSRGIGLAIALKAASEGANIVIAAKTPEAMRVVNQKLRDHELEKLYLCVVHGAMRRDEGVLDSYIVKPEGQKKVSVSRKNLPGAKHALTAYRTLATSDGLSLLECRLMTGRTHQIRAQFADAGHPLLGDTQYGDARLNARYGRNYQALYAHRLVFAFETDGSVLGDLNGRSFSVRHVPFVKAYFPAFDLHASPAL